MTCGMSCRDLSLRSGVAGRAQGLDRSPDGRDFAVNAEGDRVAALLVPVAEDRLLEERAHPLSGGRGRRPGRGRPGFLPEPLTALGEHAQASNGALVYALGLPYSWVRNGAEVQTDASGWATITLQPTAAMPLHRGGSLVIFVRARKPGDNLLAGVSTRRLVQEGISR